MNKQKLIIKNQRFCELQNSVYSFATRPNNLALLFVFCALFYIVSDAIGTINNYSPVPLFDMWNGYLTFFTDDKSFWSQHNEHRIVLSHILFWIDLKIFHGTFIFLLIANYFFAALIFVIFFFCSQEILKENSRATKIVINCVILILLFSRIQKENFDQPFQTVFFLAPLTALLAFYLIHKSVKKWTPSCDGVTSLELSIKPSPFVTPSHDGVGYFVLSCFFGIISAGTLINGILTLPLITLLLLALRKDWKLIATTTILSAITIAIYFYGYQKPFAPLVEIALHRPLNIAKYILAYLGNPFFHLFYFQFIAQLAGFFLISSSGFFAFKYLKNTATSSLQLALLTFIFFIEITAFLTSTGRSLDGAGQAFISRYSTPVLMAWISLLLLYLSLIRQKLENNFTRFALIFFLVPIFFLPKQLETLHPAKDALFEYKIAALATELNIDDQEQLSKIYVRGDFLLTKTKPAIEQNLSIFGNPLIQDAHGLIGTFEPNNFTNKCSGNLDKITKIEDPRYLRIEGQITNSAPKIIHLLDHKNKIVGYALGDKNLGFKGYLLREFSNQEITLRGFQPDCELQIFSKYD